ncbi:hypothetical protein FQR65_LT15980 [Abscondita terminalis]|nr:hypothetical protein FQR65_LT15980 [Abscondita terminalis]
MLGKPAANENPDHPDYVPHLNMGYLSKKSSGEAKYNRLMKRKRQLNIMSHKLPSDMENYMEYKIMGSVGRIKMTKGCLPSKFECQQDRIKRTLSNTKRTLPIKRQRLALINESLELAEQKLIESETTTTTHDNLVETPNLELEEPSETTEKHFLDKSVQVQIRKPYRSKSTQCKIEVKSTASSPILTKTVSTDTSPFCIETFKRKPSTHGSVEMKFLDKEASDAKLSMSYKDSSVSVHSVQTSDISVSSFNNKKLKLQEEENSQLSLQNTLRLIKKKPRFYVGIPKDCFFLIDIMHEYSKIPVEHIYCV